MASSVNSTSTSSNTATTTTTTVTVVATLTKRSLVPARWKETVRVVGMSECNEAALTLAHAFAADDYAQYIVSDDSDGGNGGGGGGGGGIDGASRDLKTEEHKWRLHVDILTYTVASHCMDGLVTAVGPECDSVAVWYVLFVNSLVQ
jgi:hypothetical protein